MRDLLESLDNIVERDFNFDDPSQNANAGGRLQTKSLPPVKPVASKPVAPKPGILDKIGAGISSLFKSNPKSAPATTPKPAAPAKQFDFDNMPKVQTKALPPVNPVAAVQKAQQTDRLKRSAAQAGMDTKDYAAQQQKRNAAALKRGPSGTVNVDPNTF